MWMKELVRIAKEEDIGPDTLDNAADAIGVVRKKFGGGKNSKTQWSLPGVQEEMPFFDQI